MRAQPTSRRSLLSGRGKDAPMRPPWTDEARIRAHCTSCGDCIAACPEAILIEGPARTPAVSFRESGCTFCGACADACGEPVFLDRADPPWSLRPEIGPACLLRQGVSCGSCLDACDSQAIRLDYRAGPVGAIRVDAAACTGCGFCLAPCPADAITLSEPLPEAAA